MKSIINTIKPVLSKNNTIYDFSKKAFYLTKEIKNKHDKKRKFKKLKSKIEYIWYSILTELGAYNASTQTFTLTNFRFKPDTEVMTADVLIPTGLSREDFEKVSSVLQQGIESLIVPKYSENKKRIFTINIITKTIPLIPYKVQTTEPYQLYIGNGIDGEPVITDITQNPHVLLVGVTGSGKSRLMGSMLCNLILNSKNNDINIYSIQIDKSDTYPFRRCRETKCFATTLTETLSALNYISHLLDERDQYIRPLLESGKAENIKQINELFGSRGWSYNMVVIEEFPSLMPDTSESKEVKNMKLKILSIISKIYQIGRYAGCFLIVSVTRSTIDKLP